MGRTATGSVVWCINKATGDKQWHARVTTKTNGSRALLPLDPKIPEHDKPQAQRST